jgi:hypothetical protein
MVGGRDCQADFAHHQFQIVPHHKATYLFTIQLLTKNSLSFPRTAVIDFKTNLSSRPERTRISCHAALEEAAYAPFREERRMKFAEATNLHRKSGGA